MAEDDDIGWVDAWFGVGGFPFCTSISDWHLRPSQKSGDGRRRVGIRMKQKCLRSTRADAQTPGPQAGMIASPAALVPGTRV
ncbi:hypothetical protein EDD85DRAFT_958760 [Armillaria nabsnona]|nr:hypothetical protein EDD85DRAFT_958760 [Armillaria nabsnona]